MIAKDGLGEGPLRTELLQFLQVTQQVEGAVAGLTDLDVVTSTSTEGVSLVVVQFTDRANGDLIANTVARQVDSVVGQGKHGYLVALDAIAARFAGARRG